jgi:serine/threonine protein kinase
MQELIMIDNLEMYHTELMMWSTEPASQVKYEDIEHAEPAMPLEYPTPLIHSAQRCGVSVVDHLSGRVYDEKEVIVEDSRGKFSAEPTRAYLLKKRIAFCTFGVVRLAMVLEKNLKQDETRDCSEEAEWRSTEYHVVIKVLSSERIRQNASTTSSNPLREIGALQLVGNYHPNVIGSIEALQDDENLYIVTPYCAGRDLYHKLMGVRKTASITSTSQQQQHPVKPLKRPSEITSRSWFRQLLQGLLHLQNKGVSHRNLSLENLLVDTEGNLVIADFGHALRVPYIDWNNFGGVTDVSAGSLRRLILAQDHGGNSTYLAPELIKPGASFDGFAVDMWSAGVILFMLLVGRAPFRLAHPSDAKFALVAQKGQLRSLLNSLQINISEEATDLLQNLLWYDPRRRLTLEEAMAHPWIRQDRDSESEPSLMEEAKNTVKKSVRFDPSIECKDSGCRMLGLSEETLSRLSLGRMASF